MDRLAIIVARVNGHEHVVRGPIEPYVIQRMRVSDRAANGIGWNDERAMRLPRSVERRYRREGRLWL